MGLIDLLDRVPLPHVRRPRLPQLGVYQRRRLGIVLCILGAGAILAAVLASSPGGPAPDARTLVPADALLYAEVHMDPSREAVAAARDFAKALPVFANQVSERAAALVPGLTQAGVGGGAHPAGWLGDEAAVAYTARGALGLLQITSSQAATRFARALTGAPSASAYRGTQIYVGRKQAAAVMGDFIAVGKARAVRAAIDVSLGAPSLGDNPSARSVLAALPGPAFARLYLASAATQPAWGLLGGGPVGAALRFSTNAMQIDADAIAQPGQPGRLADLPSFHASLPSSLGADTLAYLGVGPAGAGERTLIGGLGSLLKGTTGGILSRLGVENGGALARDLAPALGKESAVVVIPGARAIQGGFRTSPSLGLESKGVDENPALRALARLRRDVVGELRGNRVLVAGDESALQRLARSHGSLGKSERFQAVTSGIDGRVALLAYLDLSNLVPLFEAAGLAENPAYVGFAPEARRLDALGVALRTTPRRLDVALRLAITGK